VWSDPVTLWRDSADKSPKKPRPHYNLAIELCEQEKNDEAIKYYTKTLQLDPNHSDAHLGFGISLLDEGRIDEAIVHFNDALRLNPNYVKAHHCMGMAFYKQDKFDEALACYNRALQINPKYTKVHNNMAVMFYQQGEIDKAIAHWTEALRLKADWPEVHSNMAIAFYQQGKVDKVIKHWTEALKFEADWLQVLNNLAWIMATYEEAKYRNAGKSLALAKQACEITDYKNPETLDTLAAAYASVGRFPQAIETAEKAVNFALSAGKKELAKQILSRLQLYKAGRPHREPLKAPGTLFKQTK
jgi:Tfp pilus assembly protein PilF